jgi:hypothetical protein
MNRITRLAAFAVCGLGFASPALADAPQGVAGTLSAQYGQWDFAGATADHWNVAGQAAFGFAPQFGGEIDAGYANLSGTSSVDLWNIGGSAFWAPAFGRIGGTLQYQTANGSGVDVDQTQYGAFGEYFISNAVTLGLNAGGISASAPAACAGCSVSGDGGYVGGGLIGYLMPNLSLTGSINYAGTDGSDTTSYNLQAEWLFSEVLPVSGFVGYSYTDVSGISDHIDHWFIGFKYYTDGNGSTLVDKQRNGALDGLVRSNLNSAF